MRIIHVSRDASAGGRMENQDIFSPRRTVSRLLKDVERCCLRLVLRRLRGVGLGSRYCMQLSLAYPILSYPV